MRPFARARGPGRILRLGRYGLLLALLALLGARGPAWADNLAALEKASRDPSWRVRLQAASVLAKQKSPAPLSILERLLGDENEGVRSVAAAALGEIVGMSPAETTRARVALERATGDPSAVVRDRASVALAKLARPPSKAPAERGGVHVAIGGVGAKPKHVSPEMTKRLRELLVREFARTPGLTLDGQPVTGFLIDSSITALSRRTTPDWVEINCEISVIVGRLPSKAMVMMTSGGATVQQPKTNMTPERTTALEADALEGAVKGAHENLLAYLRTQR